MLNDGAMPLIEIDFGNLKKIGKRLKIILPNFVGEDNFKVFGIEFERTPFSKGVLSVGFNNI